ncbi:hypothetical protein K2173_004085 [Erythroxylum novogranatense]|uniref:Uncharacterized protein n=1 Tax=Erythroxylum novogranatense TaxID=1862640 RepID=A0AAV8SKB8_9ROSI|nr:hypothetical protein K2173_004085 [Erythroxylum novogranatense]
MYQAGTLSGNPLAIIVGGMFGLFSTKGGMFGLFFTKGPIYNFNEAKRSDTAEFAKFYRGMSEEGAYFASSAFKVENERELL